MKRIVPVAVACAALLSLTVLPAFAASPLSTTGLAYDEVTKILIGSTAPPEPGTFAADFSAIANAQKSAPPAHRGLLGGIMNTVDAAKNAVNLIKSGTASSKYYFGGMERVDDVSAQTATISKPLLHQMILLNLAKKTYRLVDTSVPVTTTAPVSPERGRGPSTPQQTPTPQPGTGKLDITVATTQLGPRVIESVPTTGYKLTFSLAETQSTGSCSDGNFQTEMVQYVSTYVQPQLASAPVAMSRPLSAMRPEMSALPAGCAPKTTMHTSVGSQPPSDRLALWALVTISGGAPSAQGPMSGGFSTLLERGNVRVLGAADKGLFEIPADFTKEP